MYLSEICYPGEEKPRKPKATVVLNFMASDCAPCKEKLPLFLKVVRGYSKDNVRAFLVATDPLSQRERLQAVLNDYQVDCGVLLDPYKKACERFAVSSIPRTFVISDSRQIIARIAAGKDYEKKLRAALKRVTR